MELPVVELLRPWALALIPLPLLAWWLLPALSPQSVVPVPASVRDLLLRLTPERRRRHRRWPPGLALRAVGWLALVIALAGPYTRGLILEKPTGRDLIIALDLSSSMDEQDMTLDGQTVPRYRVVRRLIGQFVAGRRGDRVGLIAFGHEAFLIAPLSFDTDAIAAVLDELSIGLPGHRTDLGRAVGLTVQVLREEPKASRVLVILSDGEDNSGALTGIDAARLAAQHDVRIHTIGFTAELDSDGAAVLRDMAGLTGGRFFTARSSEALAEISAVIDELEPSAVEGDPAHLIDDWSALALLLGMAALGGLAIQGVRE